MIKNGEKINILEMHSSFGYAGGQRNMFTFAKYFDKNLFKIYAASYYESGIYEGKFHDIGVETVSTVGDAEKILQFILEKKIDVIHIHRSGENIELETKILRGAKKINPDLVIVEKNVFGKYDPKNFSIIDCSFLQSMMHLNERFLPKSGLKFDFDKMKVLYNMVDVNEFEKYRLTKEQVFEAKNKLGIESGELVLGRMGRPDLAKWSDLIFDVVPYLEKLVPSFKVLLMGVPKSRVRKINRSPSLRKHFLVFPASSDEEKVHTFYQCIDILVHTTKAGECNGNIINEAMCWSKPVIANSTPNKDNGQLEQIEHLKDGILANHPQSIARAIEFLYKDRMAYENIGLEASKKIIENNTPLKIVPMLERCIIEKLAKKQLLQNLSLTEKYGKIAYRPDEENINAYKEEYRVKSAQDFGKLSIIERLVNLIKLPFNFLQKIIDFIEHKLGYERI